MKFHWKMTLSMLALLSLLFGLGGSMLLSASFRDALDRETASALGDYRMAWGTLQIVNALDPYLDRDALGQTTRQLYQQSGGFWSGFRLAAATQVIDEGGEVLSPVLPAPESPAPGQCLVGIAQSPKGERHLVLSGAVETNGDVLYLVTSHSIDAVYAARAAQLRAYLQVFFVMCLVCAALSYTVSKLLTAPLKDLSRASRKIASGQYASRVRVRSRDELGALSRDFNTMAQQLEADARQREHYIQQLHQAVERQERFVGSFAHEMKTPMTSLIGYAQLLRGGTLTPEEQAEAADYLYSEGKRLERLSRKLLELLVVKGQEVSLVPVSPGELVERLGEQLAPVYREKGIRLTWSCEVGVCLLEPDLVWSLLLNLADNAQKAMEQGGNLHIQLEMRQDGCVIQVLDDGRGIPPQALEHLTEAFYRVDKARSRKQGGFGLGLALCQTIVDLHKGSLTFSNRPEGGACVTAELRGGRP